jgi:hypothetical protein
VKKKMQKNPKFVSFQHDHFEVEGEDPKIKIKDYDKPWQINTYLMNDTSPTKPKEGKATLDQMKAALHDHY